MPTLIEALKQVLKDENSIQSWTAKQIVNFLKAADDAYYNDGTSLSEKEKTLFQKYVSDELYDTITDYLKEKAPDNPYLKKVGAVPTSHASLRMVKLPFPMASLDKLKPDTVEKWFKRENIKSILISDKVDGISLGIECDGYNIRCYTRGDGTTGQQVDYILKHVPSLKSLKSDIPFSIRGELVIPRKNFEKYIGEYANPRNLIAGIMNKGSISPIFKDAIFVAYSLINPELSPEKAVQFLKDLGLPTANFKLLKNPTASLLSEELKNRKLSALYDMDGLVLTHPRHIEAPDTSNPTFSKAYKDPQLVDRQETVVKEVIWNVGKTGAIIPLVVVEPVSLCGTEVKKATGHNAKMLVERGIGKGAKVIISKSGEIIPYIEDVLESVEPELPNIPYKWDGVHIVIDESQQSDKNNQLNIKRITHFYRTLGVENLSEGLFERLYNSGYDDILKIASLTENQLLKIHGFQKVSAQKVIKEISKVLRVVPIHKAMYGSSCFNRLLGLKRIEQIVIAYPNCLEMDKNELLSGIIQLEGFKDATAKAFVDGIPKFKKFLAKLKDISEIEYPAPAEERDGVLSDQVIVFTGFRDGNLSKIIRENGGVEGSGVSKKTTILVVADKNTTSTKAEKARSLGVKIMSKGEFENFLKEQGI